MSSEKSTMGDPATWAWVFFFAMWVFIALYMGGAKELRGCEAKANYLYDRLPAGIRREISGG